MYIVCCKNQSWQPQYGGDKKRQPIRRGEEGGGGYHVVQEEHLIPAQAQGKFDLNKTIPFLC